MEYYIYYLGKDGLAHDWAVAFASFQDAQAYRDKFIPIYRREEFKIGERGRARWRNVNSSFVFRSESA